MSGSEVSLSGSSQFSYPSVLRTNHQRETCAVTLLVVGVLVIIASISVGIAGLMNAIPLDRSASLSILIGSSMIGSSLIICSIYKKSIYNLISGLPSVASHNNSGKGRLQGIRTGIKCSQSYAADCQNSVFKSGWKEQTVAEFKVTKQNVDSSCDLINNKIDDYTRQAIIVSIQAEGCIDQGNGEIIVRLVSLIKE